METTERSLDKAKELLNASGSVFVRRIPSQIRAVNVASKFVIEEVDIESKCYYTQTANPGDYLCQQDGGGLFVMKREDFEKEYKLLKVLRKAPKH